MQQDHGASDQRYAQRYALGQPAVTPDITTVELITSRHHERTASFSWFKQGSEELIPALWNELKNNQRSGTTLSQVLTTSERL